MRRAALSALVAASLVLGASPVLAAAKPAAPAAKPVVPAAGTQAAPAPEVEHAMFYLKVLISGLQSDQVEQPVKGVLVGCLYNNSLSRISTAMDKVIAENPEKVHRDKPNEVLTAMVAICNHPAQGGAAQSAQGR